MKNKALILGCGWFGLPLGKELVQLGFHVHGTITRDEKAHELEKSNIQPHIYLLGQKMEALAKEIGSNPELIVIAIPPSKADGYIEKLSISLHQIQTYFPNTYIQSVSSTGYYPSFGEYAEDTAFTLPPASPKVFEAEQLLAKQNHSLCVLRMGGLYNSDDRHPGHWFQGKTVISDGFVNMIHQMDAVNACIYLFQKIKKGVYNVVPPLKLSKKDFYSMAFENLQREIPDFEPCEKYKWVDGTKLYQEGFRFLKPGLL
ncbi:MAG: hypothetical protein ACPF8V_05975 [Luteibaculum sp.]